MKIQCACGAKYSFDVTPDMAATPVRFICPACGADSSDLVNQLIRDQAQSSSLPLPVAIPLAPPTTLTAFKIRMHTAERASSPDPSVASASLRADSPPAFADPTCHKHAGQIATHQCLVCQKPICPKCMELFGYVCSIHCQEAADKNGLELPVYEHQRTVVRARARKKLRLTCAAVASLFLALLGFWIWYESFGAKPRVIYSKKFPAAGYHGSCKLVAPEDVLLLRAGHLTRYDVSAQKEVWSLDLLDRKKIEANAAKWVADIEAENKKLKKRTTGDGLGWEPKTPNLQETIRSEEDEAASQIRWHVHGRDVWIVLPDKLARCDWQSGKISQEIPLPGKLDLFTPSETAIVVVATGMRGRQIAMRITLPGGEVGQEEVNLTPTASEKVTSSGGRLPPFSAQKSATPTQAARALSSATTGRSATTGSSNEGEEASRLELTDYSRAEVVAGGSSLAQMTVKLIESKTVAVQAMKEPPKKSALEGTVNAAATTAIANEIFNEFQRERTGGVEYEDVSRYRVTLKRLLSPQADDWTGEVIGPPALFPLHTVNVLIARQNVTVFDKANRKFWEGTLAYPVAADLGLAEELTLDEAEPFAPCAERDKTLFLFDSGMLTAFDLASGQVRWRLPSVGISRLLFDDQGMLYLNTTDADADQIKHSQQIDIDRKTHQVILKVDPKMGKILWRMNNCGGLSKVTGKFVYAVEWTQGKDDAPIVGGVVPAHLRIYRLDTEDGSVLWEHYQRREPLALDFHLNTIQVLFKKEMQVLKFVSF